MRDKVCFMSLVQTTKVFLQYRGLLKQLVTRDVKLRYRRSVLGYVWSILNPLMVMTVMTIVFSTFFKNSIHNFAVYLLSGQVMFTLFSASTGGAIFSIVGNGALLKKTYVPKYVFVIASVTSALIIEFIFALGALLIVMFVTRKPFALCNLLFFIPAIELYVFSLGMGLFLAQANVFFRDVQYIYNAIMTAWQYLTPLFYPIEILPETVRNIVVRFNPMYIYIKQFRDFIYDNTLTDPHLILKGAVIALVTLIIGAAFFKKNQDKFILYI